MENSTTSLSIAKELRRLAQNPSHREYLLRNDVNSILIFVDPDEHPVEVVTEAINALFYLAEEACEGHLTRRSMRSTLGLIDLMKKIEQREGYSIECKALAIKIQQLLNKKEIRTLISSPSSGECVLTRVGGTRTGQKSLKFLGGNKKAKVITLQIDGLTNQDRRQQCVDELVRVKGVISLTFNMHLQRCMVRAKSDVAAEALGVAVKKTKIMEATQVVKGEDGGEVLLTLNKTADESLDKDLPPYLEEESNDSPSKEDQAIARPDSSSLGSYASSWFGSVISAVNKNLYW